MESADDPIGPPKRLPTKQRFQAYFKAIERKLAKKSEIEFTNYGTINFNEECIENVRFKFNPNSGREGSERVDIEERIYNAMAQVAMSKQSVQNLPQDEITRGVFEKFEKYAKENRTEVGRENSLDTILKTLFGSFHNLASGPVEKATERFFGSAVLIGTQSENAEELFFETYRFSSTPGIIAKSFTVISPPNQKSRMTIFLNFFKTDDDKNPIRKTIGMALGLESGTYIFGPSMDGKAFKTLVLNSVETNKPSISGGVITTDGDDTPVMGKMLLERINNVTDSRQLGNKGRLEIGNYGYEEIKEELGAKKLNQLRNILDMTLEGQLMEVSSDGSDPKKINQATMVERTQEILNQGLGEKDRFLVSEGEGKTSKPFNPASTEHYTFNSSIKI
ncbi:hypothetical protein [uncultured Sneathiella sp.]|uniref:hypothetical protein n=1 Tax=uncultured Sneathiella sp. TaxID=879315 RepID=UPI0030DAF576